MSQIVEVDDRGAIQLPADLVAAMKPHTQFVLERRGTTLVLQPLISESFWMTATPTERVVALRHWASLDRPIALPLSDVAISREQMYDE